jgi:hypothetical protein
VRTRLLTALGLTVLLAAGCTAGGDDPAPEPTSATSSAEPSATTPTETVDEQAEAQAEAEAAHEALQAALSDNLGATAALLDERKVCPATEDLACMIEVTSRIAAQAETDIPRMEAAAAAGGAPCLQEVARLQVQVMGLYVEQDRLFATGAPGAYPLDAITAANNGVKPLQDAQEAALDGC